jgi:hypothetical protein
MAVNDVIININASNRCYLILLYDLNNIDFMLGEMLYLTTMPAIHVTSTICRKYLGTSTPTRTTRYGAFSNLCRVHNTSTSTSASLRQIFPQATVGAHHYLLYG